VFHSLYCEWLEVATSSELVGLCVGALAGMSGGLAGPRVLEGARRSLYVLRY